MIISFCATQTIISWHKLEVAKSPLIIDQYAKVGIVLESWRAGDNDRHQDFQFWCRVSHEKWATRIGFNFLPITSAAHYSRMYSIFVADQLKIVLLQYGVSFTINYVCWIWIIFSSFQFYSQWKLEGLQIVENDNNIASRAKSSYFSSSWRRI